MPNKTDITKKPRSHGKTKKTKLLDQTKKTRSRIRYAAKPEWLVLFDMVNAFPPLNKWKDFDFPASLLPPIKAPEFGAPARSFPSDYDRRHLEWQKQMVEVGQALLDEIEDYSEGFALALITTEQEDLTMEEIGQAVKDARVEFRNAEKAFREFSNGPNKQLLLSKRKKFNEAVANYYQVAAEISERWLNRYERIKTLKTFLSRLAFAGRNFDSAKKRFSILDLLGFDALMLDIYLDENAILRKEEFVRLEQLLGIDAKRVRECKICRNFFWANRIDRQCCQKICADRYNKQNSRKK